MDEYLLIGVLLLLFSSNFRLGFYSVTVGWIFRSAYGIIQSINLITWSLAFESELRAAWFHRTADHLSSRVLLGIFPSSES